MGRRKCLTALAAAARARAVTSTPPCQEVASFADVPSFPPHFSRLPSY